MALSCRFDVEVVRRSTAPRSIGRKLGAQLGIQVVSGMLRGDVLETDGGGTWGQWCAIDLSLLFHSQNLSPAAGRDEYHWTYQLDHEHTTLYPYFCHHEGPSCVSVTEKPMFTQSILACSLSYRFTQGEVTSKPAYHSLNLSENHHLCWQS